MARWEGKKMKKEALLFDNLYEKCIQEWPEELELTLKSEVAQTVEDHPDGYKIIKCEYGDWDGSMVNNVSIIINGGIELSNFSDKIEEKYFDDELEILFIKMHENISKLIGKISFFTSYMKPIFINIIKLRSNFEKDLKDTSSDAETLWKKKDINLVHQYFRVNYPNKK